MTLIPTLFLRARLQAQAARLLSQPGLLALRRRWREGRRLLANRPHEIQVFLRIDDPYSYLLVQILADFQQHYGVSVRCFTVLELQDDMYPEPALWHSNAFKDAGYLAGLYGLDYPSQELPDSQQQNPQQRRQQQSQQRAMRRLQASAQLLLLERRGQPDWQAVEKVFRAYWYDDTRVLDSYPLLNHDLNEHLRRNEQRQQQLGHYLSATLYYEGEWYWGLDRLDHLQQRLRDLGLQKADSTLMEFNRTWRDFCRHPVADIPPAENKPLVLYFSARSPYSHLGLEQMLQLAQHYRQPLMIKPVLPMLMRGLKVPALKKWYIFADTQREARKRGIAYGYIADPLGAGVERCYSLFAWAQQQGKAADYLLSFSRAVNSEGVLAETDSGMRLIVQRAGLNWPDAKAILQRDDWRTHWQDWAEANRQEMISYGLWGVPSMRYGELAVWGQDRIFVIERALRQAGAVE